MNANVHENCARAGDQPRDAQQSQFLFHGTRYWYAISAENRLRCRDVGDRHVSFSRSFDVAHYWAGLPRDDDEAEGFVIVLRREGLQVAPYIDKLFEGEDEHEEVSASDVFPLSEHVVAVIPCGPGAGESTIQDAVSELAGRYSDDVICMVTALEYLIGQGFDFGVARAAVRRRRAEDVLSLARAI